MPQTSTESAIDNVEAAEANGLAEVVSALDATIAKMDALGLAAAAAHVSLGRDLVRAQVD